jgi:hypothetical protein
MRDINPHKSPVLWRYCNTSLRRLVLILSFVFGVSYQAYTC